MLFKIKQAEEKTWYGSKKLCEDNGLQLPVPDSDEYNNFLINLAGGVHGEIHLGIKRDMAQDKEFVNILTWIFQSPISQNHNTSHMKRIRRLCFQWIQVLQEVPYECKLTH